MSRDRPTSIGIIKFNARNNSVCSSPSSCTASSRRVDTLSVGAESAINQQRFVELCANDHDTDDGDGENALISAPVSEADECGSVADECCENLVQTCGVVVSPPDVPIEEVIKSVKLAHPPIPSDGVGSPQKRANEEKTPLTEIPGRLQKFWHKFLGIFHHYRTLPFRRLRLLSVAFLLVAFFLLPYFFAGLLTGVYLSLLVFLFCCVSEPLTPSQRGRRDQQRLTSIEQLDHVRFECQGQQIEPRPQNDDANENPQQQRNNTGSSTGRIYKGWMNILSEHYHPHTFHVNSIQTVLVRLDGHILRISRPERTMLKHCFHVDPTLTEPEPRMISQKIYDLTDAQVLLRPRRLARRRWFSRKYPICLKLAPTNLGIGTGDVIAKIAASGMMKRCHSLRQQQSEQGLTETYQHHMQQQRGIEWGESDDSDRADSAGDSVESESTDDEMSFCHRRPFCCAERPQQLLSTSPPPQPVLSASCPTPAATVSAAGDGRCLATTTLDPVQRRRRRRRTVPPRDNENDDDNSNSFGTLTMAKPKLQQQQRRPRCPSSAYIFLFARSAREKERWFHQLRQATLHQPNVGANDYFPAHFSTKIVHRCTSVPSLERLAAKLSDERVAYTLQNAQFSQQLASMIADLGCAAAAGTPSLPSCAVGGDAGGQQCVDGTADANSGGGGIVRMDLGWTANRSSNSNTTTKSNNGQQQQKQKQSVETEAEAHLAEMKQQHSNEFILLVNLIASRVFYDFCRDAYWCGAVRNKIQTKLATIHLPYFIETLELSKLDLGTTTPQIVKVHSPTVNEWGIWCDFDIKYDGIIRLVLETRVNLMKLKNVSESSTTATTPTASSCPTIIGADTNANSHNNDTLTEQRGATQQRQRHSCGGCCAAGSGQTTTTTALPTAKTTPSLPLSSCTTYRIAPNRYSDEEIPESPETSPDEEFGSKLKPDDHHWLGSTSGATTRRMKTGQKLISWVDRIAHSKYFREASELKLIRKMMEEISSMRLLLNVQVTTLEGRMCCNLPPPPSDRLWYAFRTPPRMSVKAVPQVGDRSVELSLVSEWIENKLQLILEKNLVLPNMDDVIVPVCSGNKLLQWNLNK